MSRMQSTKKEGSRMECFFERGSGLESSLSLWTKKKRKHDGKDTNVIGKRLKGGFGIRID